MLSQHSLAVMCALLVALASFSLAAQPSVQPVPIPLEDDTAAPRPLAPPPAQAPAPAPAPAYVAPAPSPAAAATSRAPAPPPVLPLRPKRRALEAAAADASGITYAGPSGAMSASPNGGSCAVTCSQGPDPEEYQVSCPPRTTAYCQCDTPPHAECRDQ